MIVGWLTRALPTCCSSYTSSDSSDSSSRIGFWATFGGRPGLRFTSATFDGLPGLRFTSATFDGLPGLRFIAADATFGGRPGLRLTGLSVPVLISSSTSYLRGVKSMSKQQQQCSNKSKTAHHDRARTQVLGLADRPRGLVEVVHAPDLDPGRLPADQDLVAFDIHDLSVLKLVL